MELQFKVERVDDYCDDCDRPREIPSGIAANSRGLKERNSDLKKHNAHPQVSSLLQKKKEKKLN